MNQWLSARWSFSWNAFLHVRVLRLPVHIFKHNPQFPPRVFLLGSLGTGEPGEALLVDGRPQGPTASRGGGSRDSGRVALSVLFTSRAVPRIYEIRLGPSSKRLCEPGRLEG